MNRNAATLPFDNTNTMHAAFVEGAGESSRAMAIAAQAVNNPRRNNRRRRGRLVNFSPRARVLIIPSVSEMAPRDVDALWTNDEDTRRCQRDVVEAIKAMRRMSGNPAEQDDSDDEDAICSRGLEHMRTATHLEQMRINKDCHYDAVFDEQDRQEHEGIQDDEEIALASKHCSRWARERALERARNDAAYALKVRLQMIASGEFSKDYSSRASSAVQRCDVLAACLQEAVAPHFGRSSMRDGNDDKSALPKTLLHRSISHPPQTSTSTAKGGLRKLTQGRRHSDHCYPTKGDISLTTQGMNKLSLADLEARQSLSTIP